VKNTHSKILLWKALKFTPGNLSLEKKKKSGKREGKEGFPFEVLKFSYNIKSRPTANHKGQWKERKREKTLAIKNLLKNS